MSDEILRWSSDRYWTAAFENDLAPRESGQRSINIGLAVLESVIFDGDSPAYKLVEAMCSVKEHEAWDGHRGAPRLVLALFVKINEDCKRSSAT